MNYGPASGKMGSPKVLVVPLDWGLGHATRCIPVIYELLRQNAEVWLAGEGAQEEHQFLVRQGPTRVGEDSFRGLRRRGVSADLTVDCRAQGLGNPGPELGGDLVTELFDHPLARTDQNVWTHSVPPPSVSLALRLARRVSSPEIDRKGFRPRSQKRS